MTADGGPSPPDGPDAGTGSDLREGPTADATAPLTARDRLLFAGFAAWVALLVLAAFAQVTENRFLLDLFDLRRWFTR